MRFELGLNELPQIKHDEVSAKLAGLPKGLIAGVIVKALQEGRLPTVPVAWSEDKRAINEIQDRLTELGAECYIVDHAFFPFRIATMLVERIAGDRYRKVAKEDRSLIKIGDQEAETLTAKLMHHVLMVVLHAAVVGGLFVWHVANGTGLTAVMSTKWLVPELQACGVGVFAAYLLTTSVHAVREGRLKIPAAAPFVLVSLGCTLVAILYIKRMSDEEAARRAVVRPPSNPYGGLLVELRRRQAERGPAEAEIKSESAAPIAQDEGDLMCMDRSDGLSECLGGPSWELALACLPKPKPPDLTVSAATVAPPEPVKQVQVVAKRRVVWRPWGVRLELLHLSSIVLVWMLSLVALYFVLSRRAKGAKGSLGDGKETADGSSTEGALAAAQLEVDALRAELAAAHMRASAVQTTSDDPEAVGALRRELADTQAALEVQRNGVLQLREYATRAKELLGTQAAEILALKQRLGQGLASAPQPANRGVVGRAGTPANQQGALPRHEPTGLSPSSYSGEGVHEERVSIPKRRT